MIHHQYLVMYRPFRDLFRLPDSHYARDLELAADTMTVLNDVYDVSA